MAEQVEMNMFFAAAPGSSTPGTVALLTGTRFALAGATGTPASASPEVKPTNRKAEVYSASMVEVGQDQASTIHKVKRTNEKKKKS